MAAKERHHFERLSWAHAAAAAMGLTVGDMSSEKETKIAIHRGDTYIGILHLDSTETFDGATSRPAASKPYPVRPFEFFPREALPLVERFRRLYQKASLRGAA